jgi:hypothetical protein
VGVYEAHTSPKHELPVYAELRAARPMERPQLPLPMAPGTPGRLHPAPQVVLPAQAESGEQLEHARARAWPSGDDCDQPSERLAGLVEVYSLTMPDGEVLLGAAAVGPDVGNLGLRMDDSVRDSYLCYLQRVHHGEALRRLGLGGEERQTDVHRPVKVGGGLRPPQDRSAPPASLSSAYMGLPLLRQ